MCGRFVQTQAEDFLASELGLEIPPGWEAAPNWNACPTQELVAAHNEAQDPAMGRFRWGLIPPWAKDPAVGARMINARSETIADKPSFRAAFRRRRCLVPGDGFYEWRKEDRRKIPTYVTLKSGEPMIFAGLWEEWRPHGEAEAVRAFTIITTEANDFLRPIHHRMPVSLVRGQWDAWLDPGLSDPAKLQKLLAARPGEDFEAREVSTAVNSPKNNSPDLTRPVPSPQEPAQADDLFGNL